MLTIPVSCVYVCVGGGGGEFTCARVATGEKQPYIKSGENTFGKEQEVESLVSFITFMGREMTHTCMCRG